MRIAGQARTCCTLPHSSGGAHRQRGHPLARCMAAVGLGKRCTIRKATPPANGWAFGKRRWDDIVQPAVLDIGSEMPWPQVAQDSTQWKALELEFVRRLRWCRRHRPSSTSQSRPDAGPIWRSWSTLVSTLGRARVLWSPGVDPRGRSTGELFRDEPGWIESSLRVRFGGRFGVEVESIRGHFRVDQGLP